MRTVNALNVIFTFLLKYQPTLSPQRNQDVAHAALFEMISFLHLAVTLAVHCRKNLILFTSGFFVNPSVTFPFFDEFQSHVEVHTVFFFSFTF